MTKAANIIQRRELEPLLHKAEKIVKHYEKAANCSASVMGPEGDSRIDDLNSLCKHCCNCTSSCALMHTEAVNEARKLGGSYIYVCPAGFAFWTSPFYAGERFAGALLSGGVQGSEKNSDKVKALAQMMLVCADQISGMSFVQRNIPENSGLQQKADWEKTQFDQMQEPEKDSNSLDMERMILASLRRGDNVEAKKVLNELLNTQYREIRENIDIFRLKAIELAVLLSRAAMEAETNPEKKKDDVILEANINHIRKIEESSSFEEIKNILFVITDQMAGLIFSFHGVCHFSALRKAERYIWDNYTRKTSLQEIADASGLSASYFSTIFKEEMGENLSSYLNRLRVEKAASMLITTNLPISGIAEACGFEDQSWFSKIFKNKTGLTPGKYREQGSLTT
jgi:YesN/AraC family two-component response regulator